jgi:DNA-binding response OmpR family regulator
MDIDPATGGRYALVVDDNPQAAAISSTMLQAQGWTVDRASDGFEAIVRFRARRYGALLLDYSLPGMDGVEVLTWVRRNLSVAPEVVVLSSECRDFLARRFSGLGVRAILTKPVAPAELIQALKAA